MEKRGNICLVTGGESNKEIWDICDTVSYTYLGNINTQYGEGGGRITVGRLIGSRWLTATHEPDYDDAI